MAVVSEWRGSTVLRDLARFSSDVVDQLGDFLLRGERGRDFESVCQQAQEFFNSLGKQSLESYGSHSGSRALQFTQSSEAVRVIYDASSADASQRRRTWDKLAESLERIAKAQDLDSVREDVVKLRDWFYRLSRIIRDIMRTREKVVPA